MLVHHFLEHSAESRPDYLAIVHGATHTTYAQIEHTANQLANSLIKRGAQRGDRIAILLENSPSYIAAYYGILKAGGITVPLFPSTTKEELTERLNQCEAVAI